jgi:protein-L-isoaspartate O-methyltransferase
MPLHPGLRKTSVCIVFAATAFAARAQEVEQAPFITTPPEVVERMLRLAGTGPQDFVIDLGSGDGRIVIEAARKFGARGLGIELDGALVEKSRASARSAGVADRVSFVRGDVLVSDISRASVITVYLLPALMRKLQARFIDELAPGTRVVSHSFSLTSWKPDRVETVRISRPHPGQGDESTLYLWVVPAQVRGAWSGRAGSAEWRLRIHQNYQDIEVEGSVSGKAVAATKAELTGRSIAWEMPGIRFRGRAEPDGRIAGELTTRDGVTPLVLTRSQR